MKVLSLFLFLLLVSCKENERNIVFFTASFGNALHGAISLNYDLDHNILILKRIGSKRVFPPPPPQKVYDYSLQEKDSIRIEEKQYYRNYAKPITTAYRLTDKEANNLDMLINSIPKEDRKDFYPKYPTGDGFAYEFQIIYSNGKIEDIEVQHTNIASHEKVIAEMLRDAKKYETNQNNIQVLKNFEDWNHPKY